MQEVHPPHGHESVGEGYENSTLLRLPVIRKLKESAPRRGFFEPEQFLAVRRHLREDLQLAVTIAYTYGWRMQSEVLTLERRQVDLATFRCESEGVQPHFLRGGPEERTPNVRFFVDRALGPAPYS